jgi:ABC-type nitrate/sulfonate/bicarbonate transport system ATPase subunit
MQSEAEAPVVEPRDVEAEGVEIVGAAVSYGAVAALGGVTLRVAPGEIVAVAGPSGCGKSTLLELVCGLIAPDAGSVRAPPAALMPQRDALLPWLSALDNAALALRVAGVPRARARAAAHEHFAAFGLEGFERARPAALSGGMRQRVAFLRTLLAGRPLLCLDEPFGALDALTRLQMQRWLEGALAREPRTVLLVTHDVEEAVLLADRVVLMSPRPGRIVDELDVDLARPRARTDRAVVELRERALELLGGDEAGSAGPANGALTADDTAPTGSENGALMADDRRRRSSSGGDVP